MSRPQDQIQYCDRAPRQHRPHVQWPHLLGVPQETRPDIHEALGGAPSLHKYIMGTSAYRPTQLKT